MHRTVLTLLIFLLVAAAGFAAIDFAETKKKAEAGDAKAQSKIGYAYFKRGGANDSVEAMKWWRKAAEQGYAPAQFNLGAMYGNGGRGVPKDDAEAVKWFRKAAEQGYAEAQSSLGAMYYDGEGVPKDLVQAHVWYNIAGANGNGYAQGRLATVENYLTSEQKAEAMKLARELFAKLPKGK